MEEGILQDVDRVRKGSEVGKFTACLWKNDNLTREAQTMAFNGHLLHARNRQDGETDLMAIWDRVRDLLRTVTCIL